MAIDFDAIKKLRELGVVRADFGADGSMTRIDFAAAFEREDAPDAKSALDPEPEIPPHYLEAFDTLRKPRKKAEASG